MAATAVMILPLCAVAPAQQQSSDVLPFSDLKNLDWQQRWHAYDSIVAHEDNLKRQDVRDAMMGLFELENGVIRQTLAESKGERGISDKYGESYGEYYARLMTTVEETADWHDPRQLCILADGGYEPMSAYARRLVTDGGAAVLPCLLKAAHGDFYLRYQTVPTLVHLYSVAKNLSPAEREQIRQIIIGGVRDPIVLVRQPTVEAIGKFGDAEMIPILQDVARSDPQSRLLDNGQLRFDVRDAATKAIQSIQQRAK
jgi:hypothetical protein